MTGHDVSRTGPVRDFRGYGRYIPQVRWPDGASLVVNIVLNYESGAEYFVAGGLDIGEVYLLGLSARHHGETRTGEQARGHYPFLHQRSFLKRSSI